VSLISCRVGVALRIESSVIFWTPVCFDVERFAGT
jgi:hypothetical protein